MASMAQQDLESVRSASTQECSDDPIDHVRVLRIEGTGDEARRLVLREAEELGENSVLEIEIDFHPSEDPGEDPSGPGDLHDALRSRGVVTQVRENNGRTFCLVIRRADSPAIMDLSGLEAPLPMEAILEAAGTLRAGESLFARTPCFPRPLISLLDRRALDWQIVEEPDGGGLVWVGRPG
jgi:hypothetical protein